MLKDLWKVLRGELSSSHLKQLEAQMQDASSRTEQNLRLVQQLRQMDQLIFNMSQQISWEGMRPFFQEAKMQTDNRMQIENKRIRNLMLEEVKKAYNE